MKSSPPPFDDFDLVAGLMATPEETAVLRRLREAQHRAGSVPWDGRPPSWLAPPDVARRPTAEGREEFRL